jgi:hypothetical protein
VRPQHAAARRQFRRLAVDQVEILLLGQLQVAGLQRLAQLALAHAVRRRPDQSAGVGVDRGKRRPRVDCRRHFWFYAAYIFAFSAQVGLGKSTWQDPSSKG